MSSASSVTRRQPGTAAQLHVSASPPSLGSSPRRHCRRAADLPRIALDFTPTQSQIYALSALTRHIINRY